MSPSFPLEGRASSEETDRSVKEFVSAVLIDKLGFAQ